MRIAVNWRIHQIVQFSWISQESFDYHPTDLSTGLPGCPHDIAAGFPKREWSKRKRVRRKPAAVNALVS